MIVCFPSACACACVSPSAYQCGVDRFTRDEQKETDRWMDGGRGKKVCHASCSRCCFFFVFLRSSCGRRFFQCFCERRIFAEHTRRLALLKRASRAGRSNKESFPVFAEGSNENFLTYYIPPSSVEEENRPSNKLSTVHRLPLLPGRNGSGPPHRVDSIRETRGNSVGSCEKVRSTSV